MELVEEPLGVVVHEHAGIWYGSIGQTVFHDMGDKPGKSVQHPAEKK